jgi:hypothetical protein
MPPTFRKPRKVGQPLLWITQENPESGPAPLCVGAASRTDGRQLEAIDAKFEFREDFQPSGPRFATLGIRGGHEIFWAPFSVLSRVQKRRSGSTYALTIYGNELLVEDR